MKAHFLSIFSVLFLSSFNVFVKAQNRSAQEILAQGSKDIGRYSSENTELKTFVVKMGYGESSISQQLARFNVLGATIHSIDLVYSDFPKGQDLSKLNLSRIQEMERFHPISVQNPLIKWTIWRQTECSSEQEAKGLFHGIIVYYQEPISTDFVNNATTDLNKYLPIKMTPIIAKKILDTISRPTVVNVFNRQTRWKNAVLIVDLTSSMIPYNSQVVLWQLLHSERGLIKEVVMFNDGNSAPQRAKHVGKTGGLYHGQHLSFDSLRNMSLTACRNGLGNRDFPENDLEAVLFAIKKNPNAGEYILVADNDAAPRDMALLSKINRPIRVVLCGAENGILPEYLEIARSTGGSVHTITDDIIDLMKRREGEVFSVGYRRFKIVSGRIQGL